MRTIFALLVLVFDATCFAQSVPAAWPSARVIDLSKPGALDRLEEANPEHYAKLSEVMRVASRPACDEELRVVKVELKLDNATCSPQMMLTSFPAKRQVGVSLDGVHYMMYVAIAGAPAKVMRLVPVPKSLPSEP